MNIHVLFFEKKKKSDVRGWVDQIKGVTEDKQVQKNQPKETLCQILVGNKCDIENKRQVSFQQGKELADEFGIPFIETSAKDDINVKDAFMMITKNISNAMTIRHQNAICSIRLK